MFKCFLSVGLRVPCVRCSFGHVPSGRHPLQLVPAPAGPPAPIPPSATTHCTWARSTDLLPCPEAISSHAPPPTHPSAFLRNPRLLVCDEATSALDSATEASIMASLGELAQVRGGEGGPGTAGTACDRAWLRSGMRVAAWF
jgi:hypothetical protein